MRDLLGVCDDAKGAFDDERAGLSGISCGAAIVDPKEVPDGPTQSAPQP